VPRRLRFNLCLLYYNLFFANRNFLRFPHPSPVIVRAQNNFHNHLFSFPYCYKSFPHVLVMPPLQVHRKFAFIIYFDYRRQVSLLVNTAVCPYPNQSDCLPPSTRHSPTSVYGMSNSARNSFTLKMAKTSSIQKISLLKSN